MKKQKSIPTLRRSIRLLTSAALLASVSVVLAFLAKSIFGTSPIRITFESLPIFFGSMLFGPAVGALIAVSADLLSCFLSGMVPNPVITVGAALIGLIAGVLYRYLLPSRFPKLRVFLAVMSAHIFGSMIVKSLGLYVFYGWAILYRIPIYLATAVIESLILIYLTANEGLMRQIGKVTKS